MDKKTYSNVLGFWRAVEVFNPQDVPKKAAADRETPARDWRREELPPWLDPQFAQREIHPSRMWRHSVYGATYARSRFVALLEERMGKPEGVYEERQTGESSVFYLAIDEHGRPLVETFMLSMSAWAFGVTCARGLAGLSHREACDIVDLHAPDSPLEMPPSDSGYIGFDRQLDGLREELAWRLGHLEEDAPADGEWFAAFTDLVVRKLRLERLFEGDPVHRVKSVQVRRPKNPEAESTAKGEDDFLNSFFIKDFNRLITAGLSTAGKAMRQLLDPPSHLKQTDIRRHVEVALDLLSPSRFPEGCWPAEHPLVWSQQIAINTLWAQLRDDAGTFGINGPPGTGKTTLLRDVVAAVVVERAKRLAAGGAGLLGRRHSLDVGARTIPYFPLDPALSGFSIVVASSNNGAVENVSLELPKKKAIDAAWFDKAIAYPDLAGEIIGEPAWALMAGKLGNKENRRDFVSTFWWQKGEGGMRVPGLRERLMAIKTGEAAVTLPWDEAASRFQTALNEEAGWRSKLVAWSQSTAKIAQLEQDLAEIQSGYAGIAKRKTELEAQARSLADELEEVQQLRLRHDREFEELRSIRPGLWEWLSTLGRSHRAWRAEVDACRGQRRQVEARESLLLERRRQCAHALSDLDRQVSSLKGRATKASSRLSAAQADQAEGRHVLGAHWPQASMSDQDRERSSPWAHPAWRAARIEVFIAAMNLHRAFVEDNAHKMLANLGVAMDMLGGSIPDADVRSVALDSLALVCPVLSTTFASTANLFGNLGAERIGWLLIDEAGQAPPQQAAGAVWRSRRAVVVGDPLQLEPVVPLSRTIEVALAQAHADVDARWHPSRTSVQVLADHATAVGTWIGTDEDAIWVGAPLRVHRRCDEPMFSVSNAIAYDGLMVHQKKPSDVTWPASGWCDVPKSLANGNWIPAEGEVLRTLLDGLVHEDVPAGEIFLISPFRDVVRELTKIGRQYRLDPKRVGTVHTTQGKEAEVVILVLGGGTAGARHWAASRPNLLNVAVSRAKARLYVVGDRADWEKRPHFDVMARRLGRLSTS